MGGSIGGVVWQDDNGVRDSGEPGVPGVGILLSAGTEPDMMMDTVTDSEGRDLQLRRLRQQRLRSWLG